MRTWCSCGEGRGSASNDNAWPTACNRMAAMEVEFVRDNPFSRARQESVTHQVRRFGSKYLTAAAKAANSVCMGVLPRPCPCGSRDEFARPLGGTARRRHQHAAELKLRQLATSGEALAGIGTDPPGKASPGLTGGVDVVDHGGLLPGVRPTTSNCIASARSFLMISARALARSCST
jgi:hypothetical protein